MEQGQPAASIDVVNRVAAVSCVAITQGSAASDVMFSLDPITENELVRFLIPTALGCVSYIAATAAACFISRVPRHVYIGRLVFLALFVFLIWALDLPSAALAFSGSRERYYAIGDEAGGLGTFYGMHTTWIWCIIALLKRPKARHENAA